MRREGINVELLNSNYYRYSNSDNRVVLFHDAASNTIDPSCLLKFKKSTSNINSIICGNNSSYSIYPESFMMGFSRLALLSKSDIDTYQIIDNISYIKYEQSLNINVKEGVVLGHFTKNKDTGMSFNPHYQTTYGRDVVSYDGIVLSTGLLSNLKFGNPLNKAI